MESANHGYYYYGNVIFHFKEYPSSLIFSTLQTGEITLFDELRIFFD